MTAMPPTAPTLETPVSAATPALTSLYERDEVAWCFAMAALIDQGRTGELDFANLKEVLEDMAKRDLREVKSRLRILIAHWLKWEYQPEKRTGSWQVTLLTQRADLRDDLADSGTLYHPALAVLGEAYRVGVKLAASETGLPPETFPPTCPMTLDELLAE